MHMSLGFLLEIKQPYFQFRSLHDSLDWTGDFCRRLTRLIIFIGSEDGGQRSNNGVP